MRWLVSFVVALGLLGSLGVAPARAASVAVNSLADSAADDGLCTLREAITAANTDTASAPSLGECPAGSGADAITFDVAGTIALASALPAIASDVSISGGGVITVSGAAATGELFLVSIGTVTFSGLTVTAGGGGISNLGGIVTVTNSTISGNSRFGGGGIHNSGTLTLMNSTINGNTAFVGGGIGNFGTLSVTNSTISGNSAAGGAGIHNAGTLNLTNSTISGNRGASVGGVTFPDSPGIFAHGAEILVNSIVAGNTAFGPDIGGAVDFAVETITTSVIGVPPGLTLADILDPAGLADNGGPTKTIALALVAGNPAIDTATSAVCAAALVNAFDQRGLPRPAACDIGAYEAQPPSVAVHGDVSAAATSADGAVVTYTSPAGTDEQGGTTSVACVPDSGSTFAVGSTTVTCTATDAVGHTGSGTFSVSVNPFTGTEAPSAIPLGELPNTAASSGTTANPAVLITLGLLSLGCLALGRTYPRDRRLRS